MQLNRRYRGQTEGAIGGMDRPSSGGRSTLPLLFFAIVVCACLSLTSATAHGKRIAVHNDSVPLTMDLEKGRFGTGKLYFNDPVDLAVDKDDSIYVLDAGNYRIQIVSDKGRFEDEWGARGEQDGYFDEPVALAINPDSDFLVVVDRGTYRIHKFELDGSHLLSFGEEGARKGRLKNPVDVTVDTLDYMYVLDRDRHMILKFHRSGAFVEEWGDKGKLEERLQDPVSIAYSDELTGYVYVLDAGKMALFKYQRDGELKEVINLVPDVLEEGMKPVKVEVNKENEVFVLDGLHGKLIKLTAYEINVFQLTGDNLVIEEPAGLAIDENNNVYVSDLKKNRYMKFLLELN